MEFFPSLQSRESSGASIGAWQSQFAERGWSNWAAEVLSSGEFIGFVGLSVPKRVLPPGVPENHALRPHCLYRISRAQWEASARLVEAG